MWSSLLRFRAAREVLLKRRRLLFRLLKPLDNHIDCVAEQARRRYRGIQENFSFIPDKFSHKYTAMEWPMAQAVSLVTRRDKSAALRSSAKSPGIGPSPSSKTLKKSAWYACISAIVCTSTTSRHISPTYQ